MKGFAYDVFDARRLIVVAGVVATGLAAFAGATVFDVARPFGFQDPDSESSRAYEILEDATGEAATPEIVLLVEPGAPIDTKEGREAVDEAAETLSQVPHVVRVIEPKTEGRLASDDGEEALVLGVISVLVEDEADVGGAVVRAFEDSGDVSAGGAAIAAHQINEATADDLRRIELYAAPFVFLVSLLVFRGVIAALLPLIVGAVSVALTLAALRLLADVMTIDVFALNVVTVLGLGLAIDYSLFMISRYREELEQYGPGRAALWAALPPISRMVMFSSATIAIAIASLMVFPQRFLNSIGAGGALVALLSALVAIVFLPAVLAMLGERVNALSPAWLQRRGAPRRWRAVARTVIRHPLPIATAVAALMLLAGIPFLRVELTRADARVLPLEASARQVDEAIDEHFEADPSASILVVGPQMGSLAAAKPEIEQLEALPGVAGVTTVTKLPGGGQRLEAPLTIEPSSDQARGLVTEARSLRWPDAVLISGTSAELVDQRESLREHLPLAVAIIVAATLGAILLMTGSLVLPLLSLLMNTLTVCATFGILVVIFQDGRLESVLDYESVSAIDSSVPILLFAVIFGLSTDYGVFLLSGIAEARRGGSRGPDAIARGLERSGVVITGAALLFAIAMGFFALSSMVFIKEVAVGTALAVLIDATLVRALLFPALLRLCGPAAWWPAAVRGRAGLRP